MSLMSQGLDLVTPQSRGQLSTNLGLGHTGRPNHAVHKQDPPLPCSATLHRLPVHLTVTLLQCKPDSSMIADTCMAHPPHHEVSVYMTQSQRLYIMDYALSLCLFSCSKCTTLENTFLKCAKAEKCVMN